MTFKSAFKVNTKWRRRFSCILASPLLAMSAIANFYFFAGTDIGNIFMKRFFEGEKNGVVCSNLLCLFFCRWFGEHCAVVFFISVLSGVNRTKQAIV